MKIWNLMKPKTKSPLERTSGPFYGKPIPTDQALETAHQLVDYYDALKRNATKMPVKPDKDLVHLLRCNRIAMQYYTYVNLQLQGISYKRSCLTDDEVVYTWLFAHKIPSEKPLIKLGSIKLNLIQNETKEN